MANDYWAYLREENELKHYRTSIADGGSPNKGGTKGKRVVNPDGSVTYVYDDKVASAQARGDARATAQRIENYRLAQEQRSARDATARADSQYRKEVAARKVARVQEESAAERAARAQNRAYSQTTARADYAGGGPGDRDLKTQNIWNAKNKAINGGDSRSKVERFADNAIYRAKEVLKTAGQKSKEVYDKAMGSSIAKKLKSKALGVRDAVKEKLRNPNGAGVYDNRDERTKAQLAWDVSKGTVARPTLNKYNSVSDGRPDADLVEEARRRGQRRSSATAKKKIARGGYEK